MVLNKKDFIDFIAAKNDITKKDAAQLVDTFLDALYDATKEGYEVRVLGDFATKIKEVAERTYENPQNRAELITTPAHKKVSIKLGSRFQSAVN